MTGNILIVDDEAQLRKLLARIISLEGFKVTEADSLKAAANHLGVHAVDVVLCDVKLPDGNGVDFVKTVRANFPSSEIILLTAFGNIPDGIQAMKNGAFDYIVKGNDNERIIPLLSQAVEKATTNRKLAIKIKEKNSSGFERIIGGSSVIKAAIKIAQKIAATDTNVLLTG